MAKPSEEMKKLVERQRLGFVATVCPDGTPSVSPKGTVSVLDDERRAHAPARACPCGGRACQGRGGSARRSCGLMMRLWSSGQV